MELIYKQITHNQTKSDEKRGYKKRFLHSPQRALQVLKNEGACTNLPPYSLFVFNEAVKSAI